MEDGGLGSLIFYIILGIIAIAGSFQGKNKKPKTLPKRPVQRQPDTVTRTPEARTTKAYPAPSPVRPAQTRPATAQARPVTTQPRPKYMTSDPSMEGRYEEPMAGSFSGEGSVSKTMAEAFSGEGSVIDSMARAFAAEGSIESSMAAAFASEGSSSFKDFQTSDFIHTEISDSEIGDAPEYDYNARPGGDILADGFDLKKAVIYSAVLSRKEYSV